MHSFSENELHTYITVMKTELNLVVNDVSCYEHCVDCVKQYCVQMGIIN